MPEDKVVDIPLVGLVSFPASMPDFAIETAAAKLYAEAARAQPEQTTPTSVNAINPATVGAANAGRAAAERVGMQVATSPNLGRVVQPLVRTAITGAGGALGGGAGAVAGASLAEGVGAGVGGAIENLLRSSSATLAKFASSPFARAATGAPGAVATLPITESGDRPAGETPARTAERQKSFAEQFRDQVNAAEGREVISGSTPDQIIASIAAYKGRK